MLGIQTDPLGWRVPPHDTALHNARAQSVLLVFLSFDALAPRCWDQSDAPVVGNGVAVAGGLGVSVGLGVNVGLGVDVGSSCGLDVAVGSAKVAVGCLVTGVRVGLRDGVGVGFGGLVGVSKVIVRVGTMTGIVRLPACHK